MQLGATVIAIAPRKFGCLGTVASSVSSPALIRSGASYDYGYAYGAAGHFCVLDSDGSVVTDPTVGTDRSLVRRGTAFASDWLPQLDLSVGFRLPTDSFDGTLHITAFNVLNQDAKPDFAETGTADSSAARADSVRVTVFTYRKSC